MAKEEKRKLKMVHGFSCGVCGERTFVGQLVNAHAKAKKKLNFHLDWSQLKQYYHKPSGTPSWGTNRMRIGRAKAMKSSSDQRQTCWIWNVLVWIENEERNRFYFRRTCLEYLWHNPNPYWPSQVFQRNSHRCLFSGSSSSTQPSSTSSTAPTTCYTCSTSPNIPTWICSLNIAPKSSPV